jgi:hypothetical protein
MKTPGVDFIGLKADGFGLLIDLNPITGNLQLCPSANDVMSMLERLGGKALAATRLGVEEIEIEHWIDDHYVPTRYAKRVEKLTGYSIWSMQEPPLGQKLFV